MVNEKKLKKSKTMKYLKSTIFKKHNLNYILVCLFILILSPISLATNLSFEKIDDNGAEFLVFALTVDNVQELAGIKVVITYPKSILQFKKANKGKVTQSFMHVINDKQPGKLIIVLASARGVSVRNEPLILLYFNRNKQIESSPEKMVVTECQLMSESLQEIFCTNQPYHFGPSANTSQQDQI